MITALRDENGALTGYAKVTRDLTTQHRLEKAQSALFATVTHDLRNPIFAIRMYAELLAGADAETQSGYTSRIENRAVDLGNLVDGLFD